MRRLPEMLLHSPSRRSSCYGNCMTNSRDRESLLCGCGGEEGSGGTKEDAFPPPGDEPGEKERGEHGGGTAASGAAAMDILFFGVKKKKTAVIVVGERGLVLFEEVQNDLVPKLAQIPGDDQIIEVGGAPGVLKVGAEGIISGGGACQGCAIKRAMRA